MWREVGVWNVIAPVDQQSYGLQNELKQNIISREEVLPLNVICLFALTHIFWVLSYCVLRL
jgi:hypothetical protein